MGKPVNKTLRIAAMSAGEEIGHVSGPIVTFRGNGAPLRSLRVGIDPVQAGTGDPSPDNVRPISGWSAVNVWRTGGNVWDELCELGIINSDGSVAPASNRLVTGYIPVISGETYYLTGEKGRGRAAYYDKDKIFLSYYADFPATNKTFTVPSNAKYLRYCFTVAYGSTYNHDVSFNYLSTDTNYHPYSGNQYTIQLGQTVYGGTLDVLTGKLRVTHGQIASYSGETLPGAWISSMDVYSPGTTPTIGAQVVYELATPIEYTLTPQQISSLVGENNVWADTGDVDVEYIATGGEGGKLALLLRNRKELLIALRKGLTPAEAGLLNSTPLLGGFVRPGLSTDDEKEEDELL